MRILVANKFHHVFGGSDRYYFGLNELHEKAGHHVIPFAMKSDKNEASVYDEYFVSGVNYWEDPTFNEKVKAASRIFYSAEANAQINRLIEHTKPDIAHIHLIYHQISPSILKVLKKHNIPIVQTLHDYKPICPTYSLVSNGQICERCKGKRFYQATLQRCNHDSLVASFLNSMEMYLHHGLKLYDLPDLYITPSNFMRLKMIEFGLPENKIVHVPNFVDVHGSSPVQAKDYFVYLGRLHKIKGVHTLIKAMTMIQAPHAKLMIIGTGPQQEALELLVKELGLTNITFKGYQTGPKLQKLLQESLFNVLPSEVYENCPMSVLETMALGKPTVGAKIGGIPELIDDNVDGLLFESGNAADLAMKLSEILNDREKCEDMGARAKEKVKAKYNSDIHYEAIMQLYDRCLN